MSISGARAAQNELRRLAAMRQYEKACENEGFSLIAGADEAGRGALAGPVCAAVVILPLGFAYQGIDDSKKLSPKKRGELAEVIKERAVSHAVGFCGAREIDEINILNATRKAMARAFDALTQKPDVLLIDYIDVPEIAVLRRPITRGDQKSLTIAAASILAKTARDKYMTEADEKYPQYMFKKNFGYGTREHFAALGAHGPCPLHRALFIRNALAACRQQTF